MGSDGVISPSPTPSPIHSTEIQPVLRLSWFSNLSSPLTPPGPLPLTLLRINSAGHFLSFVQGGVYIQSLQLVGGLT